MRAKTRIEGSNPSVSAKRPLRTELLLPGLALPELALPELALPVVTGIRRRGLKPPGLRSRDPDSPGLRPR